MLCHHPFIMSKPFTVENAALVWPVMTFGGLALLIVSAVGITAVYTNFFGPWAFYVLLAGFFIGLYGGIEFYTYLKRTRKLRKLLSLTSKAQIIKNLEEMEYLGWCLSSEWDEAVQQKKKEFHIR